MYSDSFISFFGEEGSISSEPNRLMTVKIVGLADVLKLSSIVAGLSFPSLKSSGY